ncbi:hypothetical protein BDD12DRAFT_802288 [Trichophaea hybrida]|nr:hypothetical protein BDD12DRAFT_802288 [Trichophaea hybrida]
MAPESGNSRESQASPNIDDDNANDDQLQQPYYQRTDTVPRILRELPVFIMCDDVNNDDNDTDSDNTLEWHQLFNATPPSNQGYAQQAVSYNPSILTKVPYPTNVDKWSAEIFEQMCTYLNKTLQCNISTTAIHVSAAWGNIAEHACKVALPQYIDTFHNMSNDNQHKEVATLITL